MAVLVIIGFGVCDLLWLLAAERRLRAARVGLSWRIVIGAFAFAMFAYILLATTPWSAPLRKSQGPLSEVAHATVFLWHFAILPVLMLFVVLSFLRRRRRRAVVANSRAANSVSPVLRGEGWGEGRARQIAEEPLTLPSPLSTGEREQKARGSSGKSTQIAEQATTSRLISTRRQFITAAALAVPPVAACALGNISIHTLYGRRLRHFDLTLPQLPPKLSGMTIAHVSDTHIGKFFHPNRLPAIAEDINKLDADFIVFTGDLIDLALDDLEFGVPFLRSLKSRCGMVICEGNHDLMEEHGAFRNLMLREGLPFISYGHKTLQYTSRAGASYPVQFLTTPWNPDEQEMIGNVYTLRTSVNEHAFPILLAHHPHCFDAAAEQKFPLTLSGHTHGGQIMLNDQTGLGKLRFRYTSGLYTKPGSSLIVNNGLGNWFPIRINAPAELIHITLRSA